MSLIEATKSRLGDESKLEAFGLSMTAQVLRKQINMIVSFGQKAMIGDPEQLQNAARDLSFSLAHIFIGKSIMPVYNSINRVSYYCSTWYIHVIRVYT